MTKVLFVFGLAAALAACSNLPTSPDAEFNALAAHVEKEIRATEKTGFLWRDTEQFLADARKAKKEGHDEEAMRLARKALRQAQLAQQQAKDNANAAPSYPNQ